MSALLEKIGVALGVMLPVSETDRGIIEAMIEIGAGTDEIVDTFGYALATIEAVKSTQSLSPYRVSAE